MTLTLSDDSGNVIDKVTRRIGFKKTEIIDGVFYLNGVQLKVNAQCSHMQHPVTGHYITEEVIRKDMEILKQFGFNAVRTSHYPPVNRYMELADEYGLYIIDETGDEAHATEYVCSMPEFTEMYRERVRRMVLRDRNHISVLFWSAGNESGGGNNFESVMKAIKALDTSRITHYEGNSQWSDVTSTMYGSYSDMLSIAKSRRNGTNIRPHIQCENTHAMGNSMGNQNDYFKDIYEPYPAMAGEFVWDWKDQGIKMPVPGKANQYYWAYGGDFGDNPNDGSFCCNGVVLADCTPTAKSFNMKGVYQPLDIIPLNAEQGIFRAKNKLQQVRFSGYNTQYTICENVCQGGLQAFGKIFPWPFFME